MLRIKNFLTIDLRSLAIFRIGIALCVIVDLFNRFPYIDYFQTSNGFLPVQTRSWFFTKFPHHWFYDYHFQVMLYVVAIILALMLLVGWYTRTATFFTWVLLVSLHTVVGITNDGADDFLRAILLWSMFLPLGTYWSIDAKKVKNKIPIYFSLAGTGLLLLFVLYYFTAGLAKLNYSWLENRTALEVIFRQELWSRPAGEFLRQYPTLLKVLTPTVVVFEILAPFILLIPQQFFKTRLITICSFIIFQIGLGVCIELNMMPWIATAALLVFLPSAFWGDDKKMTDGVKFQVLNLKNIMVVPIIIYVFGGFLLEQVHLYMPYSNQTYQMGLISSWNFYNYPPEEDYDYQIIAKLDDGEIITILESIYSESTWREPVMNAAWQNYRFKNYLEVITYEDSEYAKYLLQWIVGKWNKEHPTTTIKSAKLCSTAKDILSKNGISYEFIIAETGVSK